MSPQPSWEQSEKPSHTQAARKQGSLHLSNSAADFSLAWWLGQHPALSSALFLFEVPCLVGIASIIPVPSNVSRGFNFCFMSGLLKVCSMPKLAHFSSAPSGRIWNVFPHPTGLPLGETKQLWGFSPPPPPSQPVLISENVRALPHTWLCVGHRPVWHGAYHGPVNQHWLYKRQESALRLKEWK